MFVRLLKMSEGHSDFAAAAAAVGGSHAMLAPRIAASEMAEIGWVATPPARLPGYPPPKRGPQDQDDPGPSKVRATTNEVGESFTK